MIVKSITSEKSILGIRNMRKLCTSASCEPGLSSRYRKLVEAATLRHDPHQEKVVSELDRLLKRLEQHELDMADYHRKLSDWETRRENLRRNLLVEEAGEKQRERTWDSAKKQRGNLIQKLLIRDRNVNVEEGVGRWVSYLNRESKLDKIVGSCPLPPLAPKGLYIYGNVGSGKTMLMDMFYGATGSTVKHRKRLHFHEAMLNINEKMHKIWKSQVQEKPFGSAITSWIASLPFDVKIKEWVASEDKYKEDFQSKNILPAVADEFLIDHRSHEMGASVLCFDEIQTVDVFAIIALSGILSRLLDTGTVLVATSNRPPRDLNQDGMQKEIFQSLVEKLEERCDILNIGCEIDYRRHIAQKTEKEALYFWPLDNRAAQREFNNLWLQMTNRKQIKISSDQIAVMFGRALLIPESCNGVARFTFEELCGKPLGAADYIALATNYHTVFISNIPIMSMKIRDKARRFIILIDELYNHHCRLVCLSSSSIEDLFRGTEEGTLVDLESFQFETEVEGSKLRRDVFAGGDVGNSGSPAEIVSMMSGQEEMFAFRRAVSRLVEMQTPLYADGVSSFHPSLSK